MIATPKTLHHYFTAIDKTNVKKLKIKN